MSLPAQARQRWRLADGGAVGYLDLGGAVVIVPGGMKAARRWLMEQVDASDWDATRHGFGDPDLATE